MADAGLTLTDIKQITGHKSDSVVQGYIASSLPSKMKGAHALVIEGVESENVPIQIRCSSLDPVNNNPPVCNTMVLEQPVGYAKKRKIYTPDIKKCDSTTGNSGFNINVYHNYS
jgi:hypothetical protein